MYLIFFISEKITNFFHKKKKIEFSVYVEHLFVSNKTLQPFEIWLNLRPYKSFFPQQVFGLFNNKDQKTFFGTHKKIRT